MKSKQQSENNKKYKLTLIDWLTVFFIAAIIMYLLYVGVGYFYEHYTLKPHHHHLS